MTEETEKTAVGEANSGVDRPRRARVLKGAHAAFNEEHSAIPCTVRDISETGARLQFELGWIVPSHFTLFVDIDGYKVECEKVRHEGDIYGVKFVGPKVPTELGHRQSVAFYDSENPDALLPVAGPAKTNVQSTSAPTFGSRKPLRKQFGKLGRD